MPQGFGNTGGVKTTEDLLSSSLLSSDKRNFICLRTVTKITTRTENRVKDQIYFKREGAVRETIMGTKEM
ncbi:hypothetical protein Pmani_027947 [Petrolisthes manimaculis]|uniref:Uncharacterized protein n=1 Tax=Petrolisthes manimaculis TaxID=1843537 RepID=A0AAE1P124_9EUCA|nr:hypothetical protein Pmani_027947 [Petrolisthes manimaculis]